jgi:hypothetical protein
MNPQPVPVVVGIVVALVGLWVFFKADAIAAIQKERYQKSPFRWGLRRMVLFPWYPTYLRSMAVLSWFVAALAILSAFSRS